MTPAAIALALILLATCTALVVLFLLQTRSMMRWREIAESQTAAVDRLLLRNAELRDQLANCLAVAK